MTLRQKGEREGGVTGGGGREGERDGRVTDEGRGGGRGREREYCTVMYYAESCSNDTDHRASTVRNRVVNWYLTTF